jgi:hypothetical protein
MSTHTPEGTLGIAFRRLERAIRDVLEEPSRHVLFQVASQVSGPTPSWEYSIERQEPLRFRPVEVDRIVLQPDIACDIALDSSSHAVTRQNLVIRVWSLQESMNFRQEWDAVRLREVLAGNNKRVMIRYHFDHIVSEQNGPDFHLQVGGNSEPEEHCWLHQSLSVPRVACPPLDLVLACELVVANFFPEKYRELKDDPEWKSIVHRSEDLFQKPYIDDCKRILDSEGFARDETLLSARWRFSTGAA